MIYGVCVCVVIVVGWVCAQCAGEDCLRWCRSHGSLLTGWVNFLYQTKQQFAILKHLLLILTFLHFSIFLFSCLLFSTSLLSPSLPHYLLFPPPSCPLHFLATSSSQPPCLSCPPLLSPLLFPPFLSLSLPSLPPTSSLSPLLRYYDQLGAFENKLPISESQVHSILTYCVFMSPYMEVGGVISITSHVT